jgi:hypothetical protein
MEELLDQADKLVNHFVATGEQPRPNFPIPLEIQQLALHKSGSNAIDDPNASSTNNIGQSSALILKEDTWKGRGWFTTMDIPIGQLILVAKPIATVMDWQEYDEGDDDNIDEENEDVEPLMNELLLIETLQAIVKNPAVWHDQLSTMFPRKDSDLTTFPAWVCHNDDVFIQVETLLSKLEEINKSLKHENKDYTPLPVKDIATRLPLIVRYNVLSMETCAELLSYPSPKIGHAILAGIGLYHEPSFFNHSAKPNVSRWCIGDVMCFVSNQPISAGTELCISYIEHDILCESPYRRNQMLSMDFLDTEDVEYNSSNNESDDNSPTAPALVPNVPGPDAPVVDNDVQNELMSMEPYKRLEAIEELMKQARGMKLPTDFKNNDEMNDSGSSSMDQQQQLDSMNESLGSKMDMAESSSLDTNPKISKSNYVTNNVMVTTPWFQCDVHNLRILKAITYDGLDKSDEAYKEWSEAIHFAQKKLPPHDESLVVLHVQAALCAYHCYCAEQQPQEEKDPTESVAAVDMLAIAHEHAKSASETHQILFGGGNRLLRRRLRNEFQLKLRYPNKTMNSVLPEEIFWPVEEKN